MSEGPLALQPDAKLRALMRRYPMAPQHVVDHPVRASHSGRRRGDGSEFHQFRPYLVGDDFRRVDWRLYGRTDRLYVRESEQESRLSVCLLIDASASMGIGKARGLSKLDYARRLAAALAWLCVEQQHEISLRVLSDEQPIVVEPLSGRRQLERVYAALHSLQPRGQWPAQGYLQHITQSLAPRTLLIALSDFFDQDDEITRTFSHLLTRPRHLVSIQVLAQEELDFDYRGTVAVRDVESGATRHVSARDYRADYARELEAMLDATTKAQQQLGARFVRASTTTPVADVLSAALDQQMSAQTRDLLVAAPA